jgi:hypothetical protein
VRAFTPVSAPYNPTVPPLLPCSPLFFIHCTRGFTAGTDAYCKFTFAGGKPIKTKVVTRQGTSRHEINPEFNYEMWYPVSVPTMTQVRVVTVLLLVISKVYGTVLRYCDGSDAKWYNFDPLFSFAVSILCPRLCSLPSVLVHHT